MTKSQTIEMKRIYEPPAEDDGLRVLVDRLWPRGVKKEDAKIDIWAKELAPTNALRKWFAHEPAKFDAFRVRYLEELKQDSGAVLELRGEAKSKIITLLYAARNRSCNHAVVLQEYLSQD